jgi:glycosyltransferase involved in cell wall biosynthesis
MELDADIISASRRHALRMATTGRLPVALDLRHLPREQVGTRTYAVSLARALAALPGIELTLLVRDRASADGLAGRIVTPQTWCDDVAVIHKPAQVTDPLELDLLFRSSAHVVITYQDLIAYRVPTSFPIYAAQERYRSTSSLVLPASQRIVAISRSAAAEIAAEFGIPDQEITVVPHGVEAGWFAHKAAHDDLLARRLGLPGRFFFSLATDFPHKNLRNLLEAYAILRTGWREGSPPALLLAGHASGAHAGFYPALGSGGPSEGVIFLGPVSPEQLRLLYQRAVALVFPSLYEGFGLPPLEAMAAGTPVIAMRISAIPEVAGDCALYPDELSAASLAHAMERLATDVALRRQLREAGLERAQEFRWDVTAQATFDVYRAAVLSPNDRSLKMRRLLRGTILRWSGPHQLVSLVDATGALNPRLLRDSVGIRNACKLVRAGLRARLSSQRRQRWFTLQSRSA